MTAPADHSPVAIGSLIAGKYRVERILGAGAMGVVVAARHLDLHELRAIKLMLPAALGSAEGVERFLREARAAARLKSQHVARVHDVGRLDNGAPFAVIEYLEGSDLKAILDQRGALPPAEAAAYVLQACEAIAEAHAAGVVHRDLKPANLFLTRGPSGEPCVKVLDFGIAKVASPDQDVQMTATSALLGTPLYMSPEQMRGARDVDARSDIWAIGVILYRMLTGRTPFTGASVTEICAAVVADTPSPPRSLRPEIPPAFEAIILRCLEKNPAQRFASVPELVAALAPFTSTSASMAQAPAPAGQQTYSPSQPQSGQQTYSQSQPQSGHQTYSQSQPQPGQQTYSQQPQPGQQTYSQTPFQPVQQTYLSAQPTGQPPYPQPQAPGPAFYPPHPTATQAPYSAAAPAPQKSSALPLVIAGLGFAAVLGGAAAYFLTRDDTPERSSSTAAPTQSQPTVTATTSTTASTPGPTPTRAAAPSLKPTAPTSTGAAPASASATPTASAAASDLDTGAKCSSAAQCKSGFCVDGVCCDSACNSRCMACTAAKKFAGGSGTCGFISGGEDPDKECGSGKRCDGFGGCVSLTPAQIKNLTGHD